MVKNKFLWKLLHESSSRLETCAVAGRYKSQPEPLLAQSRRDAEGDCYYIPYGGGELHRGITQLVRVARSVLALLRASA